MIEKTMGEKVKIWIENGVIRCCSQVCTEVSCPRFDECETDVVFADVATLTLIAEKRAESGSSFGKTLI